MKEDLTHRKHSFNLFSAAHQHLAAVIEDFQRECVIVPNTFQVAHPIRKLDELPGPRPHGHPVCPNDH